MDTRALTLRLRERGTLLGRILPVEGPGVVPFLTPTGSPSFLRFPRRNHVCMVKGALE